MRIGNRHFLLLSSGSLPYYFVSLRLVIGTCHLPLSSTFVRKGTIINNMINYTNLILQVLLLFVFIIFNYKMAVDGDIFNVRCRISFYFVIFFYLLELTCFSVLSETAHTAHAAQKLVRVLVMMNRDDILLGSNGTDGRRKLNIT